MSDELTQRFYLGKYEVTQAQYEAVMAGKKRNEAEFVAMQLKAIEAFNAQTIETDQEKFVNEYLIRKGESSLSKDKSHLLDSFKDNPSILAEIQAFFAKS